MVKYRYTININKEVVEQVKEVQMNLAGCSNLSSIIEILLNDWLKQFGVKNG
jgi:uncharacterized protein YigA (DUF484 family)